MEDREFLEKYGRLVIETTSYSLSDYNKRVAVPILATADFLKDWNPRNRLAGSPDDRALDWSNRKKRFNRAKRLAFCYFYYDWLAFSLVALLCLSLFLSIFFPPFRICKYFLLTGLLLAVGLKRSVKSSLYYKFNDIVWVAPSLREESFSRCSYKDFFGCEEVRGINFNLLERLKKVVLYGSACETSRFVNSSPFN